MENMKIHLTNEKLQKERLQKLIKLIDIVFNYDNDSQKAIEMRRIYPSYEKFIQSYYETKRTGKSTVTSVGSAYSNYADAILSIGKVYLEFENNGLLEFAKNEEVFFLKHVNYLDSRFVIQAYIYDGISYDLNEFLAKYKIQYTVFKSCEEKVKKYDSELYSKYLKVVEDNKTKRLVMPIYNINKIIEGITTGKTTDGNKFDVFEFYRIAPFQNKDIDIEIRDIGKDFPKLLKFKNFKQTYVNEKREKVREENNKKGLGEKLLELPSGCTYSENLYLFTKCFNESQAEILFTWMKDNGIRNLTPISKTSTVNFYEGTNEPAKFNKNDAIEIFDTMDEEGLPYYLEIYNRLKTKKLEMKLEGNE